MSAPASLSDVVPPAAGAPLLPGHRKVVTSPTTRVPLGAIDAHSHILGPYTSYPLSRGHDYEPPEAPVDDYRALLSTVGFARSVIVQPSIYGTDNRVTLDAVAALGKERSRAVVMVPTDTSRRDIKRLDRQGGIGVRFLTMQNGSPALDGIEHLAPHLAEFGWHLQLWMPSADWAPNVDQLLRLPVPVVFDHLAQIKPDSATFDRDLSILQRALDSGNVWVKAIGYRVSSMPPRYEDAAAVIAKLAASHPERLLWGFDWPHTNIAKDVPDDGPLLDAFAAALPNETVLRQVLVDNPARLYRFQ